MSIISFLAKLWANVKALFSSLPKELKSAIALGVTITELIKKLIDSPVADLITAIIPGNLDDQLVAKLRSALPVILIKLKLADAQMDLANPNAILQTALTSISELDPDIRPGVLHQLSILIAQLAADGKITWSDGVVLLEWYYKNEFKPAA